MIYLILAHKNPRQLFRLVSRLTYINVKFVIHIDFDSNIEDFIAYFKNRENDVFFISDRKATKWASFGIIEATIISLKFINNNFSDTDRVILLSGQDYPIKPNEYIYNYFKKNKEKIFIEFFPIPCKKWINGGIQRFPYFEKIKRMVDVHAGSQWWAFPMKTIKKILLDLNNYHDFITYFNSVAVPDESFFQTLLLNYADTDIMNNLINDNLREISWHPPYIHPNIMHNKDFSKIVKSTKLFARKFDEQLDSLILDNIDKQLLDYKESRINRKTLKGAIRRSQAILMLSNKPQVINKYQNLVNQIPNEKVFLLYHETNNNEIGKEINTNFFFKFDDSVLDNLGFNPIVKSLVPGSNHFPLFSFYHKYPEFDFYWVIEDDVVYNGNWQNFFRSFEPNTICSDFISSHLKFFNQNPYWLWWNTLQNKNENINQLLSIRLSSFNPIYRISKEALIYLEQKMKEGWMGHHEVLIPSLLFNAGFTILDIGNNSSFCFPKFANKFHKEICCTVKDKMHHSSFRYRPFVSNYEILEQLLYHPVKSEIS